MPPKYVTNVSVLRYEFQMQYGSIGWSVGATLGYAQAVPEKRVLAFIGDGSFQVKLDFLIQKKNRKVLLLLWWFMHSHMIYWVHDYLGR